MKSRVIDNFINDLITFLDGKFSNDDRIPKSKKLQGQLAFTKKMIQETTKSFYVVSCLNNSPESETFNGVTTLRVNIQIDAFALAGTFDNKQYLPDRMAMMLQETISGYMEDLKFGDENKNIILMREITSSPSLPFENGDRAYFSSLRYQFTIMRDYVS